MKIPKTLGAKADLLFTLRTERLAEERRIGAMRAQEAELREAILSDLAKQRMTKGSGKFATVSAVTKVVGKVEDWAAVWEFAKKHDAFDLYQRRLNNKAWLDRVEAGERVAGVERETVVELSLTKVGS